MLITVPPSFKQLLAYISRGLNANRAYSLDTTSYRGHSVEESGVLYHRELHMTP